MDNDFLTETEAALKKSELPFRFIGAVVFGSRVTGQATSASDIDILVVADGLHPKRHRRGDAIVCLKKRLPAWSFDILLLTPQEVIANFHNHNPLFLDIAEEGEILIDTDGFLAKLLGETRRYIRRRGIQKMEGGWVFPVRRGVPTPLSEVSNKDFSLAMLKDGERDFLIGRNLTDETFYDKAVYHFQQAVEKCIKSILIAGGMFQKTHFVGEVLAELVEKETFPEHWKNVLREVADISESLEPEVSLSRYPGIIEDSLWLPFEEYEREDADRAMEKAKKVVSVAQQFVDEWFSSSEECEGSSDNRDIVSSQESSEKF